MQARTEYREEFYRHVDALALNTASVVVPIILEWLHLESVVDIGCGTGAWLSVFRSMGVGKTVGVEGEWILSHKHLLRIPSECLVIVNLTEDWHIDGHFDLALCLEVAEHLPSRHSLTLVQKLTRLSDAVLFSAAVPGQEGTHHVNEQWPEFWHELFKSVGFCAVDILRPKIWQNPKCAWFYQQNLMLYFKQGVIHEYQHLYEAMKATNECPLTLVHKKILRPQKRLKACLGLLPRLTFEAVKRRLRKLLARVG